MPILDMMTGQNTRNDQFERQKTLKQGRKGSQLSTSMMIEGEIDTNARRKTVGFKDNVDRHDKIITMSQHGDLDDSKHANNSASAGVMIDEVKSTKSPSIFDRASDAGLEMQQSIYKEPTPDKTQEQQQQNVNSNSLFHP